MDLHVASGFIYWADNSVYSEKGIFRANTDGGYFSSVVLSGIGRRGIHGLAVDWIAGIKPLNLPFIHLLSLQGDSRSMNIK